MTWTSELPQICCPQLTTGKARKTGLQTMLRQYGVVGRIPRMSGLKCSTVLYRSFLFFIRASRAHQAPGPQMPGESQGQSPCLARSHPSCGQTGSAVRNKSGALDVCSPFRGMLASNSVQSETVEVVATIVKRDREGKNAFIVGPVVLMSAVGKPFCWYRASRVCPSEGIN